MISAAEVIGSEVRLFRGDQVIVLSLSDASVIYNGQTTLHGSFAKVPPKFANGIDGAYLVGGDIRLFRGGRLVVISTTNGSCTYNGTITGHGAHAKVTADFSQDIDDVIHIGSDVRMFKGDRLLVLSANNGSVTYDGPITQHPSFTKLPADFSGDFDAVHSVYQEECRLFRGDRLVVLSWRDGHVVYDGPTIKHASYANLPASWLS
ncbi:hypothetical protein [Streptomyces lydicus]|uniref:hypothetical protein n=1 Tax=Streptomyces lydicus TaxID=47763 RepID=UPI00331E3DEE